MIYLVTNQTKLFDDDKIKVASVKEAIFYLNSLDIIGLDTETEGFDPYTNKILSLQLGNHINQYVIDTSTVDISEFKDLIEDKEKLFIMQNAKFDLRFLYHANIIPENVYDTFLAEMILYTGFKPGTVRMALDALAERYCDVHLDKTIRGQIHWRGLDAIVIKYGADDVKYLEAIMNEQVKIIQSKDLYPTLRLENEFVKVLAYIEYCGIFLNKDLWTENVDKQKQKANEALEKLDEWVLDNGLDRFTDTQLSLFETKKACNIKWDSTKSVSKLMQYLGIKTNMNDNSSIDNSFLEHQKKDNPIISLYLDYVEKRDSISLQGESWFKYINPVTNRIHSSFKQITKTGRISCYSKDKNKRTTQVDLHSIPANSIRNCFMGQNNNVLVDSDYIAQESVIFANKSRDPNLVRLYKSSFDDIYAFITRLCFYDELKDKFLKDIKKIKPNYKEIAKRLNFIIQYNGTAKSISSKLEIDEYEAQKIIDRYKKNFPETEKYFKQCKGNAFAKGFIVSNNISKRKRHLPRWAEYMQIKKDLYADKDFWDKYRYNKEHDPHVFNEFYKPRVSQMAKMRAEIEAISLNTPNQSTGADCIKTAGVLFFKWILENNYFNKVLIPNVIHDQYLTECPKEISEEVSESLRYCMEKAGRIFCKLVPLKVKNKISNNWQY